MCTNLQSSSLHSSFFLKRRVITAAKMQYVQACIFFPTPHLSFIFPEVRSHYCQEAPKTTMSCDGLCFFVITTASWTLSLVIDPPYIFRVFNLAKSSFVFPSLDSPVPWWGG